MARRKTAEKAEAAAASEFTGKFSTGPEEYIEVTQPDGDVIRLRPATDHEYNPTEPGEYRIRHMQTGGVETKSYTHTVK